MNKQVDWAEIGSGQEAYVLKGQMNQIEGIGGIVRCEPMTVAKRVNQDKSEGRILFCKHLAIKILEEFFIQSGKYNNEHIPLPLGSFKDGYYYKFAEGSEGFPYEIFDGSNRIQVQIYEWPAFVGAFSSFGIDLSRDIADANDGRVGKNVIFSGWDVNEVYETGRLHPGWKRIDFGYASCGFDYEKFENEMKRRDAEITTKIGRRHRLGVMAAYFYHNNGNIPREEYWRTEKWIYKFFRVERIKAESLQGQI